MLQGLNSNIKHQGKIFHIQTEDSGVKYGHIISHLFHEGSILASVKTEYRELIETVAGEDLEGEILKLMRKSHRKMVSKLTSGGFDDNLSGKPQIKDQKDKITQPVDTEEGQPAEDIESSSEELFEEEIDLSDIENGNGNGKKEPESTKHRKSTAEILNEEEAKELEELKKNYGFEVVAIENASVVQNEAVLTNGNDLPDVETVFKKIQSSIYMIEKDSKIKDYFLNLLD